MSETSLDYGAPAGAPPVLPPALDVEAGVWPRRRSAILDWLVKDTRAERFSDNIFVELCIRLSQVGIGIARATLHLRIEHPQWLGARFLWRPGMIEADLGLVEFEAIETPSYRHSPIAALLLSGEREVRKRLQEQEDEHAYPLYQELRQEGLTDYVAWPLDFTQDKRHVITFATDRDGGFAPEELALVADLLPAFSLVTEIRLKNRLARTILETYVGPHASEQILNGATRRGSGVTMGAAILICDLRGFTAISELWPRDDVIALLNEYFDAMATPIERHGGEILKFIGDGMLAVFPTSDPGACDHLIAAVREASDAMAELNRKRADRGLERLGYGVGVHVGDVMYGNIGSRSRLDFTVIGPAVNIAARLESLTKEVGPNVLFSAAFAAKAGGGSGLEPVGAFLLRGVGEPVEVFALASPSGAE